MDMDSFRETLRISDLEPLVLPSFGIHPWEAPKFSEDLEALDPLAQKAPMLGEVGLDFHFIKDEDQYPAQRAVFDFFIGTAETRGLILNIHTKGAEKEVLSHLRGRGLRGVVIHWYSGPLDIFRELAARGLYFTVGVEVLYSEHIQTIAQEIPLGRLLTETDNPGGPKGYIGGPGMPILVRKVVRGIAKVKNTTVEAITQAVYANLLQLLRETPKLGDAYVRALEEQHGS